MIANFRNKKKLKVINQFISDTEKVQKEFGLTFEELQALQDARIKRFEFEKVIRDNNYTYLENVATTLAVICVAVLFNHNRKK